MKRYVKPDDSQTARGWALKIAAVSSSHFIMWYVKSCSRAHRHEQVMIWVRFPANYFSLNTTLITDSTGKSTNHKFVHTEVKRVWKSNLFLFWFMRNKKGKNILRHQVWRNHTFFLLGWHERGHMTQGPGVREREKVSFWIFNRVYCRKKDVHTTNIPVRLLVVYGSRLEPQVCSVFVYIFACCQVMARC